MTFDEQEAFVIEKLGQEPDSSKYNPVWDVWQFTFTVPRGINRERVVVELRPISKEVRVYSKPLLDSYHPIDDIADAFEKMSKRVEDIPLILHEE
jgi:hypothetical protein